MPTPSEDLAQLLSNLVIASTDFLGRLPWLSDEQYPLELPSNVGHRSQDHDGTYSGINALILIAHAQSVSFPRPIYGTARQWMDRASARINTRRTTHPAPVVYFMKTPRAAIAKLSEPVFNLTDVVPATSWHAPITLPSRPALPPLRLATLAEQDLLHSNILPLIERRFKEQANIARHLICDLAAALAAMRIRQTYVRDAQHDALADGLIALLRSDPRAVFAIATQAQKTAHVIVSDLTLESPPSAPAIARLDVA